MNRVQVSHLTKIYGKDENKVVALNDVSFDLEEGEFAVILGPSGSGKTTLLNILGGMDRATSGTVDVFGKRVTSLNARGLVDYRRNGIGFVFQFYNLMPNLTARENVALARTADGMAETQALEEVGLAGRKNNFPSRLSGGEQQRVAIARAIVKKPPLLLCDEPTGALDSATGRKILALLHNLKETYRTTIVIVTHNAKLADVADRVITLSDGRIVSDVKNENPAKAGDIAW